MSYQYTWRPPLLSISQASRIPSELLMNRIMIHKLYAAKSDEAVGRLAHKLRLDVVTTDVLRAILEAFEMTTKYGYPEMTAKFDCDSAFKKCFNDKDEWLVGILELRQLLQELKCETYDYDVIRRSLRVLANKGVIKKTHGWPKGMKRKTKKSQMPTMRVGLRGEYINTVIPPATNRNETLVAVTFRTQNMCHNKWILDASEEKPKIKRGVNGPVPIVFNNVSQDGDVEFLVAPRIAKALALVEKDWETEVDIETGRADNNYGNAYWKDFRYIMHPTGNTHPSESKYIRERKLTAEAASKFIYMFDRRNITLKELENYIGYYRNGVEVTKYWFMKVTPSKFLDCLPMIRKETRKVFVTDDWERPDYNRVDTSNPHAVPDAILCPWEYYQPRPDDNEASMVATLTAPRTDELGNEWYNRDREHTANILYLAQHPEQFSSESKRAISAYNRLGALRKFKYDIADYFVCRRAGLRLDHALGVTDDEFEGYLREVEIAYKTQELMETT